IKIEDLEKDFENSNNELLIAHNNNTYQLIGGHLKKDEPLEDCLKREIKEETGIYIDEINNPFLNITTYDDNYFFSNKKVENRVPVDIWFARDNLLDRYGEKKGKA
ncbi:MAG: NUDIX domain-containing protein, partial [Lachnospiraceae bacterium]|nr:NUDIX domain-containing protein [Lachnospiraceae bacterium]